MKRLIPAAIATALMASAAVTPALAQSQTYNQRNENYVQDRREYDRQMAEYEANRARFERDRAEYDRRYGAGAFERYYGGFRDTAPVYRDDRVVTGPAYDPYDRYRNTACERRVANRSNDRTGGTVLGALIGGALGAAAAGDSSETEGAILGAIVGGTIGNQIVASPREAERYAANCDARGYYYTYNQTIPYQENARSRNGRYDANYYSRQRCRLAPAPYDGYGRVEYRYVRVCPDRNNRYRITS